MELRNRRNPTHRPNSRPLDEEPLPARLCACDYWRDVDGLRRLHGRGYVEDHEVAGDTGESRGGEEAYPHDFLHSPLARGRGDYLWHLSGAVPGQVRPEFALDNRRRIVVLILTVQGFGVFMPNGVRIFIELAKGKPDTGKIARLNMRNIRLAGSQAVFQVIIILIMAHLAIY